MPFKTSELITVSSLMALMMTSIAKYMFEVIFQKLKSFGPIFVRFFLVSSFIGFVTLLGNRGMRGFIDLSNMVLKLARLVFVLFLVGIALLELWVVPIHRQFEDIRLFYPSLSLLSIAFLFFFSYDDPVEYEAMNKQDLKFRLYAEVNLLKRRLGLS